MEQMPMNARLPSNHVLAQKAKVAIVVQDLRASKQPMSGQDLRAMSGSCMAGSRMFCAWFS